ncbi:MAG: hypothetical protein AAF799_07815 [Myxococcota bacterium]
MTDERFGLNDDEFWTDPTRTVMDVAERLWDQGRDSIAIDGPTRVEIDKRDSLPAMVVRAGTTQDIFTLDFNIHAFVTAMDLERNYFYVARINDDEDPEEEDELPAEEDLDGEMTDTATPDLREKLDLPWQTGRLRLTAIMRDRVSNRVDVQLTQSAEVYQDEAVAQFLAQQARKTPAPEVRPQLGEGPLPSYTAGPQSLPIPDERGVSLRVDRVTVIEPGAQCRIDGSFRLVPHDHERVKQIIDSPITPGTPTTAVVGITLLVVPADGVGTKILRLFVPSTDTIDPADPEVTGVFAIDLVAHRGMQAAQTYFIYAFSSEHMEGPFPAALVSQEALRQAKG